MTDMHAMGKAVELAVFRLGMFYGIRPSVRSKAMGIVQHDRLLSHYSKSQTEQMTDKSHASIEQFTDKQQFNQQKQGINMQHTDLLQTTDAAKWAAEFKKLNCASDEGTMLAWFAGAIMTGMDHADRRAEKRATDMKYQLNKGADEVVIAAASGNMDLLRDKINDLIRQIRALPGAVKVEIPGLHEAIIEAKDKQIAQLRADLDAERAKLKRLGEIEDVLNHPNSHLESIREAKREKGEILWGEKKGGEPKLAIVQGDGATAWPKRRVSYVFTHDRIGDAFMTPLIRQAVRELDELDPHGALNEFSASNGVHIKVIPDEMREKSQELARTVFVSAGKVIDQDADAVPHTSCKTPGKCRKDGVCLDAWNCSIEKPQAQQETESIDGKSGVIGGCRTTELFIARVVHLQYGNLAREINASKAKDRYALEIRVDGQGKRFTLAQLCELMDG